MCVWGGGGGGASIEWGCLCHVRVSLRFGKDRTILGVSYIFACVRVRVCV